MSHILFAPLLSVILRRLFKVIALRISTAHDFRVISARAHGRVHVQNVRDFPQTKRDREKNSPFLLHEPSDPRILFQVFAKNSLRKNLFEEEKKFGSRTWFFLEKVPYWMYFGQGEDFQLTTELSEKVQYSRNQAIKNILNEPILLMSINKALLSR